MTIRTLVAATAIAACNFSISARAQTSVTTDPVGFTSLTVNAKPANIRGFTLLSLNMARPEVYRGLIPANGASVVNGVTVLTFPANTFAQGAFDNTHYIELVNGNNAGRISDITATTNDGSASTITLADDMSASITPGTTSIRIRPMWTFATAFGANNSAGFQGGFTPSQADIIQLFDAATGQSTLYYYNTSNNRWQTGANDATNVVIPPDLGLRIERKATTPISFTLTGAVKIGPTGLFVQGGTNANNPQNVNYIPNPYPLDSVTLANSNLYTGDAATGVLGGATPSQADQVALYDTASGLSTIYYYNTLNNQWQNGANPANNVTIPTGAAITIKRKSADGSFVWYVPQPAMNL